MATATQTRNSGGSEGPSAKRSLVGLLKAAGDPLRVDILRVLSQDSFGVQELAHIFSIAQPGMSHHLKILFQSGLVVTRREGNSIFYRRALLKDRKNLDAFQASLYATVDSVPMAEKFSKRIDEIYEERAEQSRAYFQKHADKFHERQGMLCELSHYLPNLKELLDLMALSKDSRAMEIGPGQGELLEELGKRFTKVVALDSSAEMLSLAKNRVKGKGKVEYINRALETYSHERAAFDAVVLNMVLHHMPSPAQAFKKLGKMVREEGFLLIADLCSHGQQWARESCGDVWLGFDPEDLTDWAKDAGFVEKQGSYLGLKNGFQIQIRLFSRINETQ